MRLHLSFPRPGPPRVVAVTTAVAVATGALGWFVGAQVQSPADAAAGHRAPTASLVTVPVVRRSLTAGVIAQGTVSYGAGRSLTLSGTVAAGEDGSEPSTQLITKAPVAGRTLHEGDVLLEVSGRPVFVFTGPVPMYRKLVKGATGDDVRQLRAALRRLLPNRTLAATGPFNDAVIGAVQDWYRRQGYTATGPTTEARSELRRLQQAVTQAKGDATARADAKADLAAFRRTYGASVAGGEIVFLPELPTRLDTVTVQAGAPAAGEIGTVADPVLVVNGQVGSEDADLLKKGLPATLVTPTGTTFRATLAGVGDAVAVVTEKTGDGKPDSSSNDDPDADSDAVGTPIRLTPKNPKKLAAYAGQSVKISIKVGSTGSKVLTVPVAAVFTSADGHARVSVQTPAGPARDVPVTTGLSSNGLVQIEPEDADQVHVGDRVVVGAA